MLLELQQEIADKLMADPFFADVTIVTQKSKDLQSEIDQAIARLGIAGLVVTPDAEVTNGNLPGPRLDPIRLILRFGETPTLNTAGPRALACAEAAVALLHQWTPDLLGAPLIAKRITLADPDESTTGHDVELSAAGGLTLEIPELELTADVSGDPVTFACATPGAAIFYTLDGKNPAPRNGTLYTAPLDRPAAGTRLKARAYLAGYLPSPVSNTLFT